MEKVSVSELELQGNRTRPGAYAAIFAELRKLKAGEALKLPKHPTVSRRTAQNRLGAALRNNGPTPPAGCKWTTRSLADGGLAVCAMQLPGGAPKKRARKKTASKR